MKQLHEKTISELKSYADYHLKGIGGAMGKASCVNNHIIFITSGELKHWEQLNKRCDFPPPSCKICGSEELKSISEIEGILEFAGKYQKKAFLETLKQWAISKYHYYMKKGATLHKEGSKRRAYQEWGKADALKEDFELTGKDLK